VLTGDVNVVVVLLVAFDSASLEVVTGVVIAELVVVSFVVTCVLVTFVPVTGVLVVTS